MLVLDTSAALSALVATNPPAELIERLGSDDLHGPSLLDTELLHALRRLTARGQLSEERAQDALRDFDDLALVRYPHWPLKQRVWKLRHNLTAYDATFVALAELLDAPLLTCDARLASAPVHGARVEYFN
jgi:predicted nucleic acid-binding protein